MNQFKDLMDVHWNLIWVVIKDFVTKKCFKLNLISENNRFCLLKLLNTLFQFITWTRIKIRCDLFTSFENGKFTLSILSHSVVNKFSSRETYVYF